MQMSGLTRDRTQKMISPWLFLTVGRASIPFDKMTQPRLLRQQGHKIPEQIRREKREAKETQGSWGSMKRPWARRPACQVHV